MRQLLFGLLFIAPASIASAGDGQDYGKDQVLVAQLVTGTPEQKLYKLLRPHVFYGERVTDDIRAATGDPNIPVFDRRRVWGEIYTCNYTFLKGQNKGRALVCG